MKKLLTLLFVLMSVCTVMKPQQGFAAVITCDIDEADHFDCFWDGNEESLFCNIHLWKGLKFQASYFRSTTDNGQSCEITAVPITGTKIMTYDGFVLEKIIFDLELSNTKDPNTVDCLLVARLIYNGVRDGVNVTTTMTITQEGSLNNPSIDINELPVFSVNTDWNQGMIMFTNSFPYSSMK